MKQLLTGLALVGLGFAAMSATAATPDISWNYISAGYAKAYIKLPEGERFKPDGYQLNASYLLSETLYLRASYSDVSGDIVSIELDASELMVSLGLRQAVNDSVDAFFEGGFGRSRAGGGQLGSDSSNGVQAAAGFRYRATPRLELATALRYSDAGDDNSTYGDLSARARLTPMFDLYASYQFDSDVSLLATGIVLNF